MYREAAKLRRLMAESAMGQLGARTQSRKRARQLEALLELAKPKDRMHYKTGKRKVVGATDKFDQMAATTKNVKIVFGGLPSLGGRR